jgi:hypothetical protein
MTRHPDTNASSVYARDGTPEHRHGVRQYGIRLSSKMNFGWLEQRALTGFDFFFDERNSGEATSWWE